MPPTPTLTTLICDSLEKVFPDERPRALNTDIPVVGYAGERTGFQIALYADPASVPDELHTAAVTVTGPAGVTARLHRVELVPVSHAAAAHVDPAEYLRTEPGLYPDLLEPMDEGERAEIVPGRWQSIWVILDLERNVPNATGTVEVEVTGAGEEPVRHQVPLELVGGELPPLGIVNTHWFHADGLTAWYGLEIFSEDWWQVVAAFLRSAAGMSVNSVLTPVWTPPLDTEEGGTRLPTQLLGITEEAEGSYRFDTTQLQRWLDLARDAGITYLEMPHLFTQWGARATPAIYVDTPDGRERRFGWDVSATDPSYRRLLEQLLPALIAFLDRAWGLDRVLFHLSDEPNESHLEDYSAARDTVADLLADVTVVDALSSFEFYERGLVDHPIVATDHTGPFLEAGITPLWVYYCVSQDRGVANRFIAQPSTSNRVLGIQLYLAGARGFLHWGFTFYNSQFSRRHLNPFLDTCAGGAFPGGDPFMVYPGPGGRPLASIRYEVFAEAMLDHRVAQRLEAARGREAARAVLDLPGPDGFGLPDITADDLRRRALEAARALRG